MKFVQQQLKFSSNCNTFLFPMEHMDDTLIGLERDVDIDVLSSIIGPWDFQSILWTEAEGEGGRIAMIPLNFQKSLIPSIFKKKIYIYIYIIFFRTDINLNNGLLIFLLKTYNLIGVFLVLYLHYYHSSAKTIRSVLLNGTKTSVLLNGTMNIRSVLINGTKSYLYHRGRSH